MGIVSKPSRTQYYHAKLCITADLLTQITYDSRRALFTTSWALFLERFGKDSAAVFGVSRFEQCRQKAIRYSTRMSVRCTATRRRFFGHRVDYSNWYAVSRRPPASRNGQRKKKIRGRKGAHHLATVLLLRLLLLPLTIFRTRQSVPAATRVPATLFVLFPGALAAFSVGRYLAPAGMVLQVLPEERPMLEGHL